MTKKIAIPATLVALAAALGLGLAACAPEPGDTPKPSASNTPTPPPPAEAEQPTPPANPGLDQGALDQRLRDAAWANDLENAAQLISWGANVNAVDSTVQSAYLIATSEGRLGLLNLTLEHGADVAALDSWNGTGLIRAAERGHWDVTGRLVQAGVNLDHVNNIGYQAVHEAVWLGRDDPSYHATIRVLAAAGAELTRPSVNEGLTPLQMAEAKGFEGSATVLRAVLGADVGADPAAALITAAESGDANAAASALRAGAAITTAAPDGGSLAEYADARGSVAVAQLLRALGG